MRFKDIIDLAETSTIRNIVPKVRGGWTIEKIRRYLGGYGGHSTAGSRDLRRIIKQFDSAAELAQHIFYHGSSEYISRLKTGASLPKNAKRGGGYGDIQHSISVSRNRDMASQFTGAAHYGFVYPVILKKGAHVVEMPEYTDATELEDILIELWEKGIDGVLLGDHSRENSEQELAILNPNAIHLLKGFSFAVFQKPRFENLTDAEIQAMYDAAFEEPKPQS